MPSSAMKRSLKKNAGDCWGVAIIVDSVEGGSPPVRTWTGWSSTTHHPHTSNTLQLFVLTSALRIYSLYEYVLLLLSLGACYYLHIRLTPLFLLFLSSFCPICYFSRTSLALRPSSKPQIRGHKTGPSHSCAPEIHYCYYYYYDYYYYYYYFYVNSTRYMNEYNVCQVWISGFRVKPRF